MSNFEVSKTVVEQGEEVLWRDSSGYTCKAYQHGNFCAQGQQGQWEPAGLWLEGDYGSLKEYKWHTFMEKRGVIRDTDATIACCVCGGGKKSAAANKVLRRELKEIVEGISKK